MGSLLQVNQHNSNAALRTLKIIAEIETKRPPKKSGKVFFHQNYAPCHKCWLRELNHTIQSFLSFSFSYTSQIQSQTTIGSSQNSKERFMRFTSNDKKSLKLKEQICYEKKIEILSDGLIVSLLKKTMLKKKSKSNKKKFVLYWTSDFFHHEML